MCRAFNLPCDFDGTAHTHELLPVSSLMIKTYSSPHPQQIAGKAQSVNGATPHWCSLGKVRGVIQSLHRNQDSGQAFKPLVVIVLPTGIQPNMNVWMGMLWCSVVAVCVVMYRRLQPHIHSPCSHMQQHAIS